MIIPILTSAAPANWALAKQISAQLTRLGHQGAITAWMNSIPRNEGVVIYIGRAPQSTIQKANMDNDPVRVIAINAETTTIDQVDMDNILPKPKQEAISAPKRKPGRPRSQ